VDSTAEPPEPADVPEPAASDEPGSITDRESPSASGTTDERSARRGRARRTLHGARASRVGRLAATALASLRDPARAFALLLLVSLVLRGVWLNFPNGPIFDEAYYVNAARVIVGLPATNHYADSPPGFDPNTEHPALGKLLIATSMSVLGDNGLGWRLPSVIAAMIALLAVYLIVRDTGKSAWLPILVTGIAAFDNLTLVHGRIGTLDILVLAPLLVGSWLALRKRWILAGVAMGIALLIKITAIYGVAAVALYTLATQGPAWWRARRIPREEARGPLGFAVITFSIMLGGLTVLDATLSQFPSPVDHITRIITYGANLRAPITVGICPEIDSRPWQWLFNECQITYFRADTTVRSGGEVIAKFATIDFRGALNPLLASSIPIATLFMGWHAWRTRDRLAIWALTWAAANYLPYVLLALVTPRIMYIYYALPLIPALAVGLAILLTRAGLPAFVRWGFLALYVLGFVALYPFRQVP
jgi:dolichyl-phosphate-mannose--protein O-mannosyl transferase